jgi:hypothetical protein
MGRARALLLLCLAALLALPAFAGKQKPGFLKKAGKDAIADFALVPAADHCANWGWAAAAESILARDAVIVEQHALIIKVFGGQLCEDDNLDLRAMGDAVAGEYVLGPKKKMRVVTRVFTGTISAEDLIAAIRRGRPMIVFWRMHPYVAIGAAYDEIIGPNGSRLWDVRELTLLDPTAPDDEHRTVTFSKDHDDLGEINGAMEFVLFPIEEMEWVPQ